MTESATKRKATGPPDGEGGTNSAKRQRHMVEETSENTTVKGLEFIEAIRRAKDKTGRGIIDAFLTLPEPKDVPGYYEQTRLPLAIDTMEYTDVLDNKEKLHNHEYQNMTGVESDLKRLVQNAKDFNDKRSLIYEDAERVRKTASNWFVKNNPAYSDPNYVAKPTALPAESNGIPMTPSHISLKITNKSASSKAISKPRTTQPVAKAVKEPDEEEAEEEGAEGPEEDAAEAEDDVAEQAEDFEAKGSLSDFTGLTFQQAQEQMLEELINYEEGGLQIFQPFHFLPPRSLTDYYSLIKYPVSLKSVQKKVRGQHGRGPATGMSDFQSWDELNDEMSHIWRNAREYNEDGSDIYELAGELEELVQKRLILARSQVEQPIQPKIRLHLSSNAPKQSIKLKFGASKASPGTQSPRSTPGVERSGQSGIIIDNDSLRRQRELVSVASNSDRPVSASSRNPFNGSRSGSASTPVPTLSTHVSAASPPAHTNGVKSESQTVQSPALSAVRPTTTVSTPLPMAPPVGLTSRPVSGSPHPQLQAPLYPMSNSVISQLIPPRHSTPGFAESRVRPEGQLAEDSILPTLTITSSTGNTLATPCKRTFRAHTRLTQQSFTFTVPAALNQFHVIPNLPAAVTRRPYRIFVMVNGQRVSELIKPGENRDKTHPVFEAKLERGTVGRIEVEMLAGNATVGKNVTNLKDGKHAKDAVLWEKYTVFIHVMRT